MIYLVIREVVWPPFAREVYRFCGPDRAMFGASKNGAILSAMAVLIDFAFVKKV